MANTYSQLTIHVIIAVQSRANLIKKDFQHDVYKYITGIVKNKGHKLLSIGGVSDHVHMIIGLNPKMAISDLVRDIKNNSTNYINSKKWLPGKFYWQAGYGVFSYSKSQRKEIIRYVENQEEHHMQSTFREEYLKILDRSEVDFDNKYIFEFFD
jgi:putative transposase